MNALLLGILGYVLIQLAIGVLVSRGIKNEADYLLAGRRIGVGLATFSIFATWFGAETVVGAAGSIYTDGLAGGASDPFGYGACLILMGLFFAMPLWRRGLTTFADLFRQRYSINIERLAVLLIVPTSIMWAAAQIRAFGQVITASSELDLQIAISIATGVVIVYTVAGGLLADVYTDFFQGLAMILGLVVLLVLVIVAMGGVQPALNAIEPARLNPFSGGSALSILEAWAIPICGSVLAQELIARVLAVRSPQMARRASLLGGGLYLSFGLIPAFIGLVGITLLPGLKEPEQLLPLLAQQHLSTFFYILFAGALISAILSTVDSALLAASALVSHNLIVPLRSGMSETAKVRSARIGVIVFGAVAYVLALQADSVFELVEEASAFGSAGVFTVALFALFTSFGGTKSAGATLIVGLVSWVLGSRVFEIETPYLASLLAAFLTYVVVALAERRARAATPV